ncbi:MAG: DesA/ISL3 alpha bundle tail domain-containing protein, partial [Gallionellaceae bacterium]
NRYEVMTKYARSLKKTYSSEISNLKLQASDKLDIKRLKHWLHLDEQDLSEQQKVKLGVLIHASPILQKAYTLRQELAVIWQRSSNSKENLVKQLEDWCHRAENSGILALQEFSKRLRCYA